MAMSQAPGLSGHARRRPLLECRDQRVLREILGQPDVVHDTGESGNQLRRLDAPDRVDGAVGVGSRHGSQSHHAQRPVQVPRREGRRLVLEFECWWQAILASLPEAWRFAIAFLANSANGLLACQRDLLAAGGDLSPKTLLLLAQLRRELRPEVLGLEDLADLDL